MGDLRIAIRSLASGKFATGGAVLALSLGIAGAATFFTLLNALFIRPLPAPNPEQLFAVATGGEPYAFVRYSVFEYLDQHRTLPSAFAFTTSRVDVSATAQQQFVEALFVSGKAFDVLGIQPRLGRFLTPADTSDDAPTPVVLGFHHWQAQYGGSDQVLGKPIMLSKRQHVIVGVAPRPFRGLSVGTRADVILPLPTQNKNSYVAILGRLADGESLAALSARLRSVQPAIKDATNPYEASPYRENYLQDPFSARSGATGISPFRQRYGRALAIVMAAVIAVLLLACGTVNTLLLGRTLKRQQEFSIRLALGASKWRLIRQQLAAGAILALGASLIGVGISVFAAPAVLSALSTQAFVLDLPLGPDIRAVAFVAVVAVLTILVTSGASAWYATRANHLVASRTAPEPYIAGLRIANVAVGVQVSLSVSLIAVAWLVVATLVNVRSIDLGFDPSRTLLVLTDYSGTADGQGQRDFIANIESRLSALPEIEAIGVSATTPIGNAALTPWVELTNGTKLPQGMQGVLEHQITPDWLTSFGSSIASGRDFSRQDRYGAPLVALVNRAFEQQFGNGSSVLGKELIVRNQPNAPPRQLHIVGVVSDAAYTRIKDAAPPTLYTLLPQHSAPSLLPLQISIRVKAAVPMAVGRQVAAELEAAAPSVGFTFRTFDDQVGAQYAQERVVGSVGFFFGFFAVVLALLGVFAVMQATVNHKRFEIAVRLALGANGSQVVRAVFGGTMRMVGGGVCAGLILSAVAGRLVSGILFGVEPAAPSVLIGSVVILLCAAGIGAIAPTVASLRTDPAELFRRGQ